MICAHCDHDIDAHFEADGTECCTACVVEILDGEHAYSDYVDETASTDQQIAQARAWACVDFDH